LEEQHTVSLLIYTKHIPLPQFNFEITSKNDEYPMFFNLKKYLDVNEQAKIVFITKIFV
jgi:hypothetical protein